MEAGRKEKEGHVDLRSERSVTWELEGALVVCAGRVKLDLTAGLTCRLWGRVGARGRRSTDVDSVCRLLASRYRFA